MEYKAIVCLMVLADVDVNACIKKEVKILFIKRITFLSFSFSLNDANEFL